VIFNILNLEKQKMGREYALALTDIQGKILNIQPAYVNSSDTVNVANLSKGSVFTALNRCEKRNC
jgi:hypothetical protein